MISKFVFSLRYFPQIFGPTEDQPLDQTVTMEAFQRLTEQVNQFLSEQETATGNHTPMTSQEVAMGFVRVANEAMCRPIRALTQVTKYFSHHSGPHPGFGSGGQM